MAENLVANAQIPVPWSDSNPDPHEGDPQLSRLKQKVLMPGDEFDPALFDDADVERFKEAGGVVSKAEFVSDEERANALSLGNIEAFMAGKRLAYQEMKGNADVPEEEIDKAGRVVSVPSTVVSGANPPTYGTADSDDTPAPPTKAKAAAKAEEKE